MRIGTAFTPVLVIFLSGCSSAMSCDAADALDAVSNVVLSNPARLRGALSEKLSGQYLLEQDTAFLEIDRKLTADQEKLDAALKSCHQSSRNYVDMMQRGFGLYYTLHEDEFSVNSIDSDSMCKPVENIDGSIVTYVEGDTAFHRSTITPIAIELAGSIKRWSDYREGFRERTRNEIEGRLKQLNVTFKDIVMTDQNSTTGAVTCKATAIGHVKGVDDSQIYITFLIEKTTSGDLLATVWGL